MTKTKRIGASFAVAAVALVILRLAVVFSQLSKTPYHDATLGADLLKVFFLQVPAWIFAVSASVFVAAFLVVGRKEPNQPPEPTAFGRGSS